MQEGHSAFYASRAIQSLFARELQALAPILSGVYGNYGLFLRAHDAARLPLPAHLIGKIVALHADDAEQFSGDATMQSTQLAFANDSFQLLVAQHCFESVHDLDACAAEVSRVLAPEGVLLILGFNPLGTWRPWLGWQRLRGAPSLRLRSAADWQQRLGRQQIDTLQIRFPGLLLPNDDAITSGLTTRWFARFGSSWLLLARKRRSTLTPLRLRKSTRELALNPRLAPGAQRACA